MSPQDARETYRRFLGETETIVIRRYHGTGVARPKYEDSVRARVVGYQPGEVVGTVLQGDRRAIVLAEDLEAGAVVLPILVSDKAVVRGKELAIIAVDDSTRRIGATLCAYELQLRG